MAPLIPQDIWVRQEIIVCEVSIRNVVIYFPLGMLEIADPQTSYHLLCCSMSCGKQRYVLVNDTYLLRFLLQILLKKGKLETSSN